MSGTFDFILLGILVIAMVFARRSLTDRRTKLLFLAANLPLYYLNAGAFSFLGWASENMEQAKEMIFQRAGIFPTQVNALLSVIHLLLGITIAFTIVGCAAGNNRARKAMVLQIPLLYVCGSLLFFEGFAHRYKAGTSSPGPSLVFSFLAMFLPYFFFFYYYAKSAAVAAYFGEKNSAPTDSATRVPSG